MSELIKHLISFNRKERFILLEEALGSKTFQLSPEFGKKLACCLDLKFEIPSSAYVAMDYHIGWIQMAIYLDSHPDVPIDCIPIEVIQGVNNNQQDVDLLVAFADNSDTHLVFIEAKADTPWDYKQLGSKVSRLQGILPSKTLKPHFVLISPSSVGESKHINVSEWPDWMKRTDSSPNYMQLKLASHLRKITRYGHKGHDRKQWKYYRIDSIDKSRGEQDL